MQIYTYLHTDINANGDREENFKNLILIIQVIYSYILVITIKAL